MKKTIILSTNDNEIYLKYYQYITKAWNNLGWETITFYTGDDLASTDKNLILKIEKLNGYREETILQCIRLLGYKYVDDGIIMTSDMDMMPLSDYWQPKFDDITVYGFDLTNYSQIPICYIAANKKNWESLIPENSLEDLLSNYTCTKSNNFNEYWYADQIIATERILKRKFISIERGKEYGLAAGRIDRVMWERTKNSLSKKIDAHLPRPFNEDAAKKLLKSYHSS